MSGSRADPQTEAGIPTQEETDTSAHAILTSERIAGEIRRDDAVMAEELRILAPQRRGVYHRKSKKSSSPAGMRNTDSSSPSLLMASRLGGIAARKSRSDVAAISSVKEKESTETFIERKREMGLVRISLESKKAEIRKLDDAADRAEKQLRQKQDQLESIKEKFNSFLKSSSLEQDAAMRRVDFETKAKYEKMLEIKKLTARIGHIESEMRKINLQLDRCKSYKEFLNGLTKPQWFYNVLVDLRLGDCTQEILEEAEAEYAARAAELKKAVDAATVQEHPERHLSHNPPDSGAHAAANASPADQAECLSIQLNRLHTSIQQSAQNKVKEVQAQLQATIQAMPLEEVKNILDTKYPESRIPLPFRDVNQLLDVFIDIEEGNLFLIQNCQELEEELEGVTISFVNEKNGLQTMVDQRHSQMSVLQEKITATEEKLKELEDRLVALDKPSTVVNGGKPTDALPPPPLPRRTSR
ncbi:unnamed protein product [Phytomonas sp. EM1]|nr:unnamed protein product [Phytomonas sp. EM1]|eukprot:CCW62846.1 unnamed protein product [Phytomonas sp. isolate EM1]